MMVRIMKTRSIHHPVMLFAVLGAASGGLSSIVTWVEAELRSITGGEGSYTIEFSHYDPVPSNVAQRIIAASKKASEEA